METLIQDLRYAARMLVKSPGFAVVALVVVAVGIGANTAIFTVANAVLLRPIPYPEPQRLVRIWTTFEAGTEFVNAYLDFKDWQAQSQAFEVMTAFNDNSTLVLTGGDEPLRLWANFTTPAYFDLVGVAAAHGRTFLPEENSAPGGHPVAVLSHGLWQRAFGGEPGVVGQAITLSGLSYTVIGILPQGFQDVASGDHATDVWVPLMMSQQVLQPTVFEDRRHRNFSVLARLKAGWTLDQARQEMEAIAARLAAAHPASNKGVGVKLVPLRESLLGATEGPVWALLAGAGFVLLIGCANVANLLLVRASSRRRETALRLALGASRTRLLRQLTTETLLLSLAGGGLGVFLSLWMTKPLVALSPADLPAFVELEPDATVLVASLVLAVLTGLAAGLAPALAGARVSLRDVLHQAGRSGTGDSRRARNLLVVAEVAVCVVLLVGAGLVLRSAYRLHTTGLGVETDNLLTVRMDLPSGKYADDEAIRRFGARVVEEVGALPGATEVDLWSPFPPGQANWYMAMIPEGQTFEEGYKAGRFHLVSPGALRRMGIPLVQGRGLRPEDREDAVPVAVVSRALAHKMWPGENPLGKRFRGRSTPWIEVVGVAEDVKLGGRLGEPGEERKDFYLPFAQRPFRYVSLLVRSDRRAEELTAAVRQAVAGIDPDLPLYDISLLSARLVEEEAGSRFTALLLGGFALLALALAALGLYSVLAYSVSQRTHEIGVRMALGAQRSAVLRMVVGQGMGLVVAGLAIGLVGAFALTHLLESLLYGVSTTDLVTFSAIPPLLALVALLACLIPASRGTRVDPVVALRQQ